MAEPFTSQITGFGCNFAPRGWAFCNGQLLPVAQNSALFSLLGTTFGGDGRTTFGLPDLRGRAPVQFGHGAGLTDRRLGSKGGAEKVTLNATTMPSHTHVVTLKGTDSGATESKPENNHLASGQIYAPAGGTLVNLAADASTAANTGGNQPHDNMPPFLAINFCIALMGIFPSRS